MRLGKRFAAAVQKNPAGSALAIVALAASLYVIAYPFTAARYAPMTDLPFHAAQTGALRHFFDPSYHLRDQFELHPLAVPYMSSYVIGALFMFLVPAHVAVKIAAVAMLALLPAGLAVLFHGMKKSPLLGLAGLPFAWSHLTHWGFLNFVGALGLFAMAIGVTLLLLDAPSRRRQITLSAILVLLFFTHVFRFPFAIAGVVAAAVVMYPATGRFRPILAPLVPPLVLFAVWTRVRPAAIGGPIDLSQFDTHRLDEIRLLLLEGGFHDPIEAAAIVTNYRTLGLVALISLVAFALSGRASTWNRRAWSFVLGSHVLALSCAGAFLLSFLMLPMQQGVWWYVYPREATALAFLALALLPDLPRAPLLRAPLVLALALAPIGLSRAIATNYRVFDRATEDFHRIVEDIPRAPRLMYLVFDHGGSTKKNTPFIHLPAYVQADKGGWLSFHFAVFGASPLVYRSRAEPSAVIPPHVPTRWEWTPHKFRPLQNGRFFDWFLVRSRTSPDGMFREDPSIVPVNHVGTWWLYRRKSGQGPLDRR
ncbi:hypothetical protein KEG38_54225 [Polyangium jinanense]|uniref:hypothetical protein n=1 Tax=Polyangium jinanense TaxID=2829994 RepID=UPI0023412D7E|nr:hypothetical protein [Polyangium jinanense]MDC3962883.1 hypothetical protein [Polyangium jinanense]